MLTSSMIDQFFLNSEMMDRLFQISYHKEILNIDMIKLNNQKNLRSCELDMTLLSWVIYNK